MLGYNKPFPLAFLLFAFVVFLIPAKADGPVKSMIITPFTPFARILPAQKASPVINKKDGADTKKETASERLAKLEKEIESLKAENIILANDNRELKSKLSSISSFIEVASSSRKINEAYELISADVILADDSSSWRKGITINRGSNSKIEVGLPVVYGKYLVGRVVECGPFNSRVQLLTDPVFRIKAFAAASQKVPSEKKEKKDIPETIQAVPEKTAKPTASGNGVLEGKSTSECILKYISRSIPVEEGWIVFSAQDISETYPKGLLIGEVVAAKQESYFSLLTVKPFLDFNSLENVIIIKKK
ncbi:MAG: rod shape-determining protein MreC [Planctomycetes bacterium]|nr:rod shape-determining protein MreC [Planctomycetota bacterium]